MPDCLMGVRKMIGRFIMYLCDADQSYKIMSRVLRRLISVKTLEKLAN